jgi:hypothetical protein
VILFFRKIAVIFYSAAILVACAKALFSFKVADGMRAPAVGRFSYWIVSAQISNNSALARLICAFGNKRAKLNLFGLQI